MFKNIFKIKPSSKYPIGLGTSDLPNSIYQGKQPITSKEFKSFVNKYFKPKINSKGFKGRDFYFYRTNKEYTEAIFFWTYRAGGAIQVDLMVKFNDIKYPNNDKVIKPNNIRPENAEFLRRLSPFEVQNNDIQVWFWIFKKRKKENKRIINDIWCLFETCGLDYFNHFKNHKKYIENIGINNFSEFPDFYIQKFFGRYIIGIVYFLFKYWLKFNDRQKAKVFAMKGIEIAKVRGDLNYKIEFEKYMNNQNPIANKKYT